MPVSVSVAVQDASSEYVLEAGAKRLGAQRRLWPLLRKGSNVDQAKIIDYVHANYDTATPSVALVDELADYAAISCWGHVFDGWRYLSLAASALLQASRGKALHLAYYAELRAAMCILACSGIVTLKRRHYSITSTGELRWFSGPTHEIVWQALTAWSKNPANALAVVHSLKLDGFLGVPWLEICRSSASAADVAGNWLENWSVDLAQMEKDREARNEASYRPDLFENSYLPLRRDDVELVRIASLCSLHSVDAGYTPIQAVLAADLCQKSADFRYGGAEAKLQLFWRETLRTLLRNGLTLDRAREIISFLRKILDDSAGTLLRLTDPKKADARSVFCRALFMLHLASAVSIALRDQINHRVPTGRAAWPGRVVRQFGLQANLWAASSPPQDLSSVEADSELACETVDRWIKKNASSWCARKLWTETSMALSDLVRFERHYVSLASGA